MKKITTLFISAFIVFAVVYAAQKINIFKTDKSILSFNTSAIDSINFSSDQKYMNVYGSDNSVESYLLSEIDSIYFSGQPDTVVITYSGSTATVDNPLENEGVIVDISGADVTVNSLLTDNEVCYLLKGSSTDGSIKFYSTYKFDILLDGLTLTNANGPAINNQSKKKTNVVLMGGTTSTLTDASTYATSTEDQKGTFFSEGQLIFSGTGALQITGNYGHGICSDDYIEIENGTIQVLSAVKDGIHAKDHFYQEGGSVQISASGDAVECEDGKIKMTGGTFKATVATTDTKGLKCDSALTVTGGTITMTVSGSEAKGIKAGGIIQLNGGTINITTTGATVLSSSGSGYDPSYCTAIKGDTDINIDGSNITIAASGAGNKGISSDSKINVVSGTLNITNSGAGATYTNSTGTTDSYSAACLTSDGAINLTGGTITCSASGSGGKTIKTDGTVNIGTTSSSPSISLTTTGSKFVVSTTTSTSTGGGPGGGGMGGSSSSTDYCHPKTIVSDGTITITNGDLNISSTDDGIHSETAIIINGGNTNITNSVEGIESLLIKMNAGYVNVTASDDGINATQGTTAGGTETTDASYFYMNGGTMITSATTGDAIDSNGNFAMTGGTLIAFGPANNTNEDIDVNGTILINGGLFFGACYNSSMFVPISSSSTQVGVNLKASSTVSTAGSLFHFQDSNGTDIATIKTPRAAYYFHLSSPNLKKSSTYYIYTGGTYSGGTVTGSYYSGGTYSGGTLKKTFTTSSSNISTLSL